MTKLDSEILVSGVFFHLTEERVNRSYWFSLSWSLLPSSYYKFTSHASFLSVYCTADRHVSRKSEIERKRVRKTTQKKETQRFSRSSKERQNRATWRGNTLRVVGVVSDVFLSWWPCNYILTTWGTHYTLYIYELLMRKFNGPENALQCVVVFIRGFTACFRSVDLLRSTYYSRFDRDPTWSSRCWLACTARLFSM